MNKPLTDVSIRTFVRRVDSLIISAESVPSLRKKLRVLETNGLGGWQTLRHPQWIGDRVVAILLRPDYELEAEMAKGPIQTAQS